MIEVVTYWLPLFFAFQYFLAVVCYLVRKQNLTSAVKSADKLKLKKLMIVFGSGGHTSEMLMMLEKLQTEKYGRVYFVIAMSDTWSQRKINDYFLNHVEHKRDLTTDSGNIEIVKLYRSREVKQSYFTSIFTTLIGLLHSCWIILQIRPDMVSPT